MYYMYKPVGDMGCSTSKLGIYLTKKQSADTQKLCCLKKKRAKTARLAKCLAGMCRGKGSRSTACLGKTHFWLVICEVVVEHVVMISL